MAVHPTSSNGTTTQNDNKSNSIYAAAAVFQPEKVVLEEPDSGYLWCRECERVFRYGQFKVHASKRCCPFEECKGALGEMAYPWEVRRTHHPAFPKYPVEGKMYRRGC